MRAPAQTPSGPEPGSRTRIPLWLPWLAAPAFALLPIAGCGLAASVRHADRAQESAPPNVPVSVVATIMPS